MLTALSIRNVVLIDRLDLEFAAGLSVLTGETGAGKSILLDALGLAIGARANSDLVRHGAAQATVSAIFDVARDHPVHGLLAEQGLGSDGAVLLRRVLSDDGRSRAFVNDQPTSVGMLRQLGDLLVEIEGQFAQHGLMDEGSHIHLLDDYGRLGGCVASVADAFAVWREAIAAREAAEALLREAARDEAFLRHAVEELDLLAPGTGEEADLAAARHRLMNREKILEALAVAEQAVGQEAEIHNAVRSAHRALERVADAAGSDVGRAVAALDRTTAELEEVQDALTAAAGNMDIDAAERDRIEERLFALREAARKHRVQPDDLPGLRTELAERLAALDDRTGRLASLAKAEADTHAAYTSLAETLSARRTAAARDFANAVNAELPPLRLDKARFGIRMDRLTPDHWRETGLDSIAFEIATNPGAPAGPLARVASGGELARLLLAIRLVLSAANATSSIIFDEVDSGVGGATAAAVGERLSRLARDVQVLVVTHSPQVAARGDDHLLVRKSTVGDSARTEVVRLTGPEREEEVARMLSGATVTAEARAAATRLIERTGA